MPVEPTIRTSQILRSRRLDQIRLRPYDSPAAWLAACRYLRMVTLESAGHAPASTPGWDQSAARKLLLLGAVSGRRRIDPLGPEHQALVSRDDSQYSRARRRPTTSKDRRDGTGQRTGSGDAMPLQIEAIETQELEAIHPIEQLCVQRRSFMKKAQKSPTCKRCGADEPIMICSNEGENGEELLCPSCDRFLAEEPFRRIPEWAATTVMSFGKFRGMSLSAIARTQSGRSYLSWLRIQPWLRFSLRKAIDAALAPLIEAGVP